MFYLFVDLETIADETQDLVSALQDEVSLLEDLVSNLEAENTQLLERLTALETSVISMNASTDGKINGINRNRNEHFGIQHSINQTETCKNHRNS